MTSEYPIPELLNYPQPSAVMMVGVPGSGKSFVAEWLSQATNYPILSSDATRAELTGNENDLTRDKEVWSLLYSRAQELLGSGQSVIIDATHNTLKQRLRDTAYYRSVGAVSVVAVHVLTQIEVAHARNTQRTRVVPGHVIQTMHERLTISPPCVNDGFDGTYTIQNNAPKYKNT